MSLQEASRNYRAESAEHPRGQVSEKMPVSCAGEHLEAETVRMWWGKEGNLNLLGLPPHKSITKKIGI